MSKINNITEKWDGHTHLEVEEFVKAELSGKQGTIDDLSDIRSGAAAGATAYQRPASGVPKNDLASDVQTSLGKADTALQEHQDLSGITEVIPEQASAQNQLADKNFVNSSVSTNTAEFKGTFSSLSDLQAVSADNNDYGFVVSTDASGNTIYNRYKYNGTAWVFEYSLNNSSFTAAQWAAIESGITSGAVAKLGDLPTATELANALLAKQDVISDLSTIRSGAAAGATAYQKPGNGIPSTDMTQEVQTSLGKANSALQAHQSLAGLAASVSYDSNTKRINFYDKDGTALNTYVDATAFIKDGMVSSVAIDNGNLVISFNTDAGKEPISIPLTNIFNPENYYTKTQVNAIVAGLEPAIPAYELSIPAIREAIENGNVYEYLATAFGDDDISFHGAHYLTEWLHNHPLYNCTLIVSGTAENENRICVKGVSSLSYEYDDEGMKRDYVFLDMVAEGKRYVADPTGVTIYNDVYSDVSALTKVYRLSILDIERAISGGTILAYLGRVFGQTFGNAEAAKEFFNYTLCSYKCFLAITGSIDPVFASSQNPETYDAVIGTSSKVFKAGMDPVGDSVFLNLTAAGKHIVASLTGVSVTELADTNTVNALRPLIYAGL